MRIITGRGCAEKGQLELQPILAVAEKY